MDKDKSRRQVRHRVRKHRSKHRLQAELRQPGIQHGRRPTYRVVELIDDKELPRAVVVLKFNEALPKTVQGVEVRESRRWLPSNSMSRRMAARLRRHRIEQVEQWCGGSWPFWLPISGTRSQGSMLNRKRCQEPLNDGGG